MDNKLREKTKLKNRLPLANAVYRESASPPPVVAWQNVTN